MITQLLDAGHNDNRTRLPSPIILTILLLVGSATSLEIPLDFHGHGHLGRYLNSDTIRYYMDASVDFYCTMIKEKNFSFYINYRDDLDVAGGTNGVLFDPRYAHYYIVGGFDYFFSSFFTRFYYMHDCVHDIDYSTGKKPIFNRLGMKLASKDYHYSQYIATPRKFLWAFSATFYAHWQYHGWDVNAGADYNYDMAFEFTYKFLKKDHFGCDINPRFQIAQSDTAFYHQHLLHVATYYLNNNKRLGINLDYNIYNNDPIKGPNRLWLLSISTEF